MDLIDKIELQTLDNIYHDMIFISLRKESSIFFSDEFKGVTPIEIAILELVDKNPSIILKDIIKVLHLPNSTLTNAINRLEKRTLVRRVISQRDKRSFGLELTEKGELAQKEHKEGETKLYKRILNSLTDEERKIFLKCLHKIINEFNNNTYID